MTAGCMLHLMAPIMKTQSLGIVEVENIVCVCVSRNLVVRRFQGAASENSSAVTGRGSLLGGDEQESSCLGFRV